MLRLVLDEEHDEFLVKLVESWVTKGGFKVLESRWVDLVVVEGLVGVP